MKITFRLPQPKTVRATLLTIGGLGLLSAAAWTLATAAGLAAAGVSLLLLEWLTREEPDARQR